MNGLDVIEATATQRQAKENKMSEISDLERRLNDALDRMRGAHQVTWTALQEAQARIAALEAEAAAKSGQVDTALLEALEAEAEAMAAAISAEKRQVAALAQKLAEEQAEVEALMAALGLEKDKVASLTEEGLADKEMLERLRLEVTATRAGDRIGAVQSGAADEAQQERITALEVTLQQLQLVNAQLRQNNAALRRAHEAGVADVDLINAGLQAEVEALMALRAADRAEMDSILAALKQLVEETEDA